MLFRSAAVYTEAFEEMEEVVPPVESDFRKHVYHIYAVRVPERDDFIRRLEGEGISCGIHYPIPVHLQEAYRPLGYQRGAFEVSERTSAEFVSLPMFPELTDGQRNAVISAVAKALPVAASP